MAAHDDYLAEVERKRIARVKAELEGAAPLKPRKRCLVCDNPAAPDQDLCRTCQAEFGDYGAWPKWLRFLCQDARRNASREAEEDAAGLDEYDEDNEPMPLEEAGQAMEFDEGTFPHGTHKGYAKHGCRCGACRAAQARYMQDHRQKRP